VVIAAVHCADAPRHARAGTADDEAKILLRALSFDRALAARAGTEVVISVVYDARASNGEGERDGRVHAFRKLAGRTIAGLPMRVISSDCSPPSRMDEALRGVDIVYLARGAKACVRAVTAATRKLRIASLASERALVEQGVTIGVTIENARPRLLVNLKASKAEGLDLTAQMLQLAEVIK
jgi:hypothetical protein